MQISSCCVGISGSKEYAQLLGDFPFQRQLQWKRTFITWLQNCKPRKLHEITHDEVFLFPCKFLWFNLTNIIVASKAVMELGQQHGSLQWLDPIVCLAMPCNRSLGAATNRSLALKLRLNRSQAMKFQMTNWQTSCNWPKPTSVVEDDSQAKQSTVNWEIPLSLTFAPLLYPSVECQISYHQWFQITSYPSSHDHPLQVAHMKRSLFPRKLSCEATRIVRHAVGNFLQARCLEHVPVNCTHIIYKSA